MNITTMQGLSRNREDSPYRSRSVMDSMELKIDKMEICSCGE